MLQKPYIFDLHQLNFNYQIHGKVSKILVLETGLSAFYLITLTVARKVVKKIEHRIVNYRSYNFL